MSVVTPESQLSSVEEPRWICLECFGECVEGWKLEEDLVCGDSTIWVDTDGMVPSGCTVLLATVSSTLPALILTE